MATSLDKIVARKRAEISARSTFAGGETVAYDYTILLRTRIDSPFPA